MKIYEKLTLGYKQISVLQLSQATFTLFFLWNLFNMTILYTIFSYFFHALLFFGLAEIFFGDVVKATNQ